MSRPALLLVASFALLPVVAPLARAQRTTIVPTIGISKDMRSQTSNRWNAGLNVGAGIFFQHSDVVSFGGRLAYHRWGADGDGWAKDEAGNQGGGYTYQLASSSGSQSVIEIVPSARFALTRKPGSVKVAAQVGAGVFIVNQGEVSISGAYQGGGTSGQATFTYGKTSRSGGGLQAALPITFGGVVEVMPIYSLYFAGDTYHHIGLSVGGVIGR